MTRIVAGIFDAGQSATAVARELRSAGYDAADPVQVGAPAIVERRGIR